MIPTVTLNRSERRWMSLRHLLYNRLPNNTVFRNTQCWAARCAKVWVGVLGKHIICVCARCVSNKCVCRVRGGAVWVSHQNLIETVCFLQSFLRSNNTHSAVPVFLRKDVSGVLARTIWLLERMPKCLLDICGPHDRFSNNWGLRKWQENRELDCTPGHQCSGHATSFLTAYGVFCCGSWCQRPFFVLVHMLSI